MVTVAGLPPYLPLERREKGRLRGSRKLPTQTVGPRTSVLVSRDIRLFVTKTPRGLKRPRVSQHPDERKETGIFAAEGRQGSKEGQC